MSKHNYNDMQRDVNHVLNMDMTESTDPNTESSYMEYCKPPYIFVAVPIVFAAILYFMKPGFVMEENPDNKDETEISLKKVGIYSTVLTVIVVAGYYYMYGKNDVKKSS